ncbi:MAG: type II toxin-antitoxin system RelE/ParE family toxin [Pirellulales bacterium]
MTTYRVELTPRAECELDEAANWIASSAPETAQRWYWGFISAMESLASYPRRCGLATEQSEFPYELRQLLYGRSRSYRAIFTIRDDTVTVLAIRHAKQADLSPSEV